MGKQAHFHLSLSAPTSLYSSWLFMPHAAAFNFLSIGVACCSVVKQYPQPQRWPALSAGKMSRAGVASTSMHQQINRGSGACCALCRPCHAWPSQTTAMCLSVLLGTRRRMPGCCRMCWTQHLLTMVAWRILHPYIPGALLQA